MSLTIFEKNALFAVVCDHIEANYTSQDITVSLLYFLLRCVTSLTYHKQSADTFFEKVSTTLSADYGMERSGNAWRRKYGQLREEAMAFFIRPEDAWKADEVRCLRVVKKRNEAAYVFSL